MSSRLAVVLFLPIVGVTSAYADAVSDDTLGEIIVTGTRIERTVTSSVSPIDVLTSDEIKKTGAVSVRQALVTLIPSFSNTSGYEGQASGPVKSASFKGLQADQTLVLVNGKRRHGTALLFTFAHANTGSSPTDLDLIPVSAIERIEVLRDGAAAQYGSDAIAGVINIILKSGSRGGSASLQGGSYPGGQGATENGLLGQGLQVGQGGHLSLALDVSHQERTNWAGINPNRLYFPVNGQPDPREATADRRRQILGLPRVNRASGGYDFAVPLSDELELYSFSTLAYRDSGSYGTYRAPNSLQNIPSVYPEGYLPKLVIKETDFQAVFGIRGPDLAGWKWDLSTSYARDAARLANHDSLNPSLGPDSPTSFYLGKLTFSELLVDFDVTRAFETGVFARPLEVAAGTEFRQNRFQQHAGDEASYVFGGYVIPSGPLAGQRPNGSSSGYSGFPPSVTAPHSRHNGAFYVDLSQKLTARWEVGVAGRYEDYSDVGSTTSGKFSTRFEVTEAFALRGTVSNGFRAPSLQQLTYRTVVSSPTIDPVTHMPSSVLAVTLPPTSPEAVALGARPLKPERSTNYSAGFVWQPLSRASLTVDAYRIDVRDRIRPSGTLSGPAITAALNAAGLSGSQNVTFFTNLANTRSEGVDIVATYRNDLGALGTINWSLTSNFNHNSILSFNAAPAPIAAAGINLCDRVCAADLTVIYPRNRTTLSPSWTLGPLNINLRETRYSSVTSRLSATNPALDDRSGPSWQTDLEASYTLMGSGLQLTLGAINLFNEYPREVQLANRNPYLAGGGSVGVAALGHNYNIYSPLSENGGFYYARVSLAW